MIHIRILLFITLFSGSFVKACVNAEQMSTSYSKELNSHRSLYEMIKTRIDAAGSEANSLILPVKWGGEDVLAKFVRLPKNTNSDKQIRDILAANSVTYERLQTDGHFFMPAEDYFDEERHFAVFPFLCEYGKHGNEFYYITLMKLQSYKPQTDIYLLSHFKEMNQKEERMTENEVVRVLKNMAEAVNKIHMKGMIYNDVRLENFVFFEKDNTVELLNYHILTKNGHQEEFSGSVEYANKEKLEVRNGKTTFFWGEKVLINANPNIDMWALGISFYKAVCGFFDMEANFKHEDSNAKDPKKFVNEILDTIFSEQSCFNQLNRYEVKYKVSDEKSYSLKRIVEKIMKIDGSSLTSADIVSYLSEILISIDLKLTIPMKFLDTKASRLSMITNTSERAESQNFIRLSNALLII